MRGHVKIEMQATVVELSSGALNGDSLPRARLRIDGADHFCRDVKITNVIGLWLDQTLKVTFTWDEA
jgi:hypothetical protein